MTRIVLDLNDFDAKVRPASQGAEAQDQSLTPSSGGQFLTWPLLVLDPGLVPDAGEFLARCRRCGWASPRQATPKAALAAFAAHSCQERPA
jgi:hypothetical protein